MRRGFTLVEMLVAMVVVGLVGAALIRLLSNQQRLSVTQVEQAMLQSNVRVGTQVLASELQEMGSDVDSVDLVTANASSVTYRAMLLPLLSEGGLRGSAAERFGKVESHRPLAVRRLPDPLAVIELLRLGWDGRGGRAGRTGLCSRGGRG